MNKNNYDIAKLYQEMELHLIDSMQRNLSRHLKEEKKKGFDWPQWQAEKLKEIKKFQRNNSKIVGKYQTEINKEISEQLKKQFAEGSKHTIKEYRKAMKKGFIHNDKVNKSFFGINYRKVDNLIESVTNDLKTANHATLRMMNDQYRQIVHKSALFYSNGVLTEKQAIDMATKEFLNKGLNCIEYSNGNRVNIASYAQMAVNTANQRAMLQGEGEFRKKIGNSLVRITKHGTACKLCQPWEEQILIDDVYSGGSKNDGSYPLLSEAMKQGLYHPNCRHGIGTYYSELDDIKFDDKGPTENTLNQYKDDLNYCNLQIQRYKRLEIGSLDKNNIYNNKIKKNSWMNKKENYIKKQKIFNDLNDAEKYALNSYISSDSYIINDSLRNDYDLDSRLIKVVDNLSTVLEKIPDTPGTYNRSLFFYDDSSKNNFINSMYEIPILFKDFTSMSKDVYDESDNIRLIIKVKHGKDISLLNPNEKEVLLQRNTKFKLLKTYKKNDKIFFELEEL